MFKKFFWLLLALHLVLPSLGAAEVFFYHTDPAGTPVAMTDANGAVVWQADYKPFGEENVTTASAANDRRFGGKEKDEESGLSYFGARYQDAKTGRFLAPDSVRAVDSKANESNERMLINPQRLNLYAYSLNNPSKYVDPDGKEPLTAAFVTAFFANLLLGSDANAPEYKYTPTLKSQTAAEFAGGVALMEAGERLAGGAIRSIGNVGGKAVQKIDVAEKASNWLGDGSKVIKNEAGDRVFLSKDGARRVRFDIKRPHPHENPHAHVEELVNGRWQKSGPIYPTDVSKK